jgi:RNA polymerase sigma-70 factor (ECF subfamily)
MQNADVMPSYPSVNTRAVPAEGLDDFDAVMRAHQQHVYRVLVSLVRDPDAADTLTQECFLRAYRKRESFRGDSSLRTWLVAIAVNLARDHVRNRRTSFWKRLFQRGRDAAELADTLADKRPTADKMLSAREELGAVWTALDSLSERQRTVFALRFVDDLSLEQIAAVTGTTVGTVKTHLFRATATLRQLTGREK